MKCTFEGDSSFGWRFDNTWVLQTQNSISENQANATRRELPREKETKKWENTDNNEANMDNRTENKQTNPILLNQRIKRMGRNEPVHKRASKQEIATHLVNKKNWKKNKQGKTLYGWNKAATTKRTKNNYMK